MTFLRTDAFLAAAGLGAAVFAAAASLAAGLVAGGGSMGASGSPEALWNGDGLIRRTLPCSSRVSRLRAALCKHPFPAPRHTQC